MSVPQDSLGGPNLAAVYHDWFKGHAEAAGERPPKGEDEASSKDMQDIREGFAPLPPGSTCIFDLEPLPHGCEQLYWPTWHFELYDEHGTLRHQAMLNNEHPAEDGFVGIQAPESPSSVWTKSSGYRLICNFDPNAFTFKGYLEVSGEVGALKSGVTVIPWTARK